MFARVSTYQAGDADRILEGFRSVTEPLEQIDGFSQAHFLVDRQSGKAMSITMWETEEALNASAAQAEELRRRGSEMGGASIESVQHYEVGLSVGARTAAR